MLFLVKGPNSLVWDHSRTGAIIIKLFTTLGGVFYVHSPMLYKDLRGTINTYSKLRSQKNLEESQSIK